MVKCCQATDLSVVLPPSPPCFLHVPHGREGKAMMTPALATCKGRSGVVTVDLFDYASSGRDTRYRFQLKVVVQFINLKFKKNKNKIALMDMLAVKILHRDVPWHSALLHP